MDLSYVIFNVARALGRLGADVSFQSRLSRDNFGEALAQSLLDAHVDLTNSGRGDEPTTLLYNIEGKPMEYDP